jgi:restriction system protein
LKVLENGNLIKTSDLPKMLLSQKYFNLSPADLAQKKATGGSSLFYDRVAWGKTYLKQGKFITQPNRGFVQITDKGMALLAKGVSSFTLAELKKDTDYTSHEPNSKTNNNDQSVSNFTPQDLIDIGIKKIAGVLQKELHEKLYVIDPYYFQNVILVLFQKMGYGDFISTPKSGDGGIDGIINQDQLGVERIYIQAKRYKEGNKVREPDIRNFIGAMSGDVRNGIFVTTSTFDESAIHKAKSDRNHTIILIDGDKLVELMIKFNIGVQVKTSFEVKELDEDFFELN